LSTAQSDIRRASDAQSTPDRSALRHFGRGNQGLSSSLGMIAEPSGDVHRIAEIGDRVVPRRNLPLFLSGDMPVATNRADGASLCGELPLNASLMPDLTAFD
jgi:hypothetical protein